MENTEKIEKYKRLVFLHNLGINVGEPYHTAIPLLLDFLKTDKNRNYKTTDGYGRPVVSKHDVSGKFVFSITERHITNVQVPYTFFDLTVSEDLYDAPQFKSYRNDILYWLAFVILLKQGEKIELKR